MFSHVKETIRPVRVDTPDPQFGQFLLEQFGGATGELTAALQYWVQSFHVEDAAIRDMLQDIALEEFSHLEMVGKLIAQHTQKIDQTEVYAAPLFAVKGMGPHFLDSRGQAWTAAYINEGGNVVRDLRADIAAEAGARQTYEALINLLRGSRHQGGADASSDARNHACQNVHEGTGFDGKTGRSVLWQRPTRRNRECRLQSFKGRRFPRSVERRSVQLCSDPQPAGGFPPAPVNSDDEKIHSRARE